MADHGLSGGLTGILLVGGASTRFGSPKALAPYGAGTLAEHAWDTLAFCDERLAVGKQQDDLDLPFPVLDDGSDVRAPLAGLVAGLRAARHEVSVVLPVDTPRVDERTLRLLAERCRDAAVPRSGPLPGAYRGSALAILEQALQAESYAIWKALQPLDVARVDVDPALLANVNTPDDLDRI